VRRVLLVPLVLLLLAPAAADAKRHHRPCIPASSPRYDQAVTKPSRLCHPAAVHHRRAGPGFDQVG
jgi:hypothetical protein